MKTYNDFKVIDGIATLDGISYLEEIKVVNNFLKDNPHIKYASLISKDKRYFKLDNNRLIQHTENKFINPFYDEDKSNLQSNVEEKFIFELNSQSNIEDKIELLSKRLCDIEKVQKITIDVLKKLILVMEEK